MLIKAKTRLIDHLYRYGIFSILICAGHISYCQSSISLSFRDSHILGTSAFFRGEASAVGEPIDAGKIYAFRYGKRLSDDIYWHKAYGYPEVGFGLEYLDIENDREIGNPFSAYGFVEAGLIDKRRFRLAMTVDFGISVGWKPYNTDTNPFNLSLGSRLNYHAGLGFRTYTRVTDQISILVAAMLNHHSNGAVTKPNLGINMASIELGLKYHFKKPHRRSEWTANARTIKPYSVISFFTGSRNLVIDGDYYPFFGLHLNRIWPISGMFMYGAGLEFLYDPGSFADDDSARFSDRYSNAIYFALAFKLERISMSMDFGRYIFRKVGDRLPTSQYYQRLGISYDLTENIVLALKVRAFELRKADLLEVHVGYKL